MKTLTPDQRIEGFTELEGVLGEGGVGGAHLMSFLAGVAHAEKVLAEPEQEDEPTKAEVAVYLFAAWLTCQPEVMEIGASCDASPMAQAIDQYFKEHPERMFEAKLHPAPRKPFVRLSEDEIESLANSGLSPNWTDEFELYHFARAVETALMEKNNV